MEKLLQRLLAPDLKIIDRLTEKRQTTIEREVDFLAKARIEGKIVLLHVEFQSTPEKDMLHRFAEYHGILFRKFKMPIKHVMFYVGDKPFRGPNRITEDGKFEGMEVFSVVEQDYESFLNSSIPAEIIFAILGDLKEAQPQAVFSRIYEQLKGLPLDEATMRKYLSQLGMLSKLRKLHKVFISTKNDMPIIYDITQDEMYLKGMEKGVEKGMKKGKSEEHYKMIRRGMKQGLQVELLSILTNLPVEQVKAILIKIQEEDK
ncbi:MAG: hypothetical protein AAGI38_14010 [Bacteroidota bacterium]